jgi:hypothetical protein
MPRPYRSRRIKQPVAPPFRWFLTPAQTCLSLSISRLTLQRWMQSWLAGNPQGPEPIILSRRKDGSPSQVRYRWEQVLQLPEGTFLEQLKAQTMQVTNNAAQAVAATASGASR